MDVTSSNMKYKHIVCVGEKKGPRLQALFWGFLLSSLVFGSLKVQILINEFSKDVTKLLLLPHICFPFSLSRIWNLVQRIVSDKNITVMGEMYCKWHLLAVISAFHQQVVIESTK